MITKLVEWGAKADEVIDFAEQNNHFDVIDNLMKSREHRDKALHYTILHNHLDRSKQMIELGVNINGALCFAAQNNQINDLNKFTNLGANINQALLWAVKSSNVNAVAKLIELGADIAQINPHDGTFLLSIAARNKNVSICEIILCNGEPVRDLYDLQNIHLVGFDSLDKIIDKDKGLIGSFLKYPNRNQSIQNAIYLINCNGQNSDIDQNNAKRALNTLLEYCASLIKDVEDADSKKLKFEEILKKQPPKRRKTIALTLNIWAQQYKESGLPAENQDSNQKFVNLSRTLFAIHEDQNITSDNIKELIKIVDPLSHEIISPSKSPTILTQQQIKSIIADRPRLH